LFIGSFQHTPNIDAVLYFTMEVFPGVQRELPGIRFYVIGSDAPPQIMQLASEEVIVTGYQPDVRFFFDSIRLSVAPLRYGAGVKGKINQSMGLGVPVVATSVAIEGMSLMPEKDVLIGDDAQAFAAAVVRLYRSEELWLQLSRNSLLRTSELFSVETARTNLARLLEHRARSSPIEGTTTKTQGPFPSPCRARSKSNQSHSLAL
jgi:glycosyltransferase involved in cell wall biosynthesis